MKVIHVRLHVDSLWAHSRSRDSIRNWNTTIIILEFTIVLTGSGCKISEILAVGDSLKDELRIFHCNSQIDLYSIETNHKYMK